MAAKLRYIDFQPLPEDAVSEQITPMTELADDFDILDAVLHSGEE